MKKTIQVDGMNSYRFSRCSDYLRPRNPEHPMETPRFAQTFSVKKFVPLSDVQIGQDSQAHGEGTATCFNDILPQQEHAAAAAHVSHSCIDTIRYCIALSFFEFVASIVLK